MDIKKGLNVLLFGEILGFIFVLIFLYIKGIGSDGEGGFLYTALFWIANDMVQIAKKLRLFSPLIVLFIFFLCIITVSLSAKINKHTNSNNLYWFFSILNGILINIILIYFLLNYAYFLGALITVPFVLGGLLMFTSISQIIFDKEINEFKIIKKFKSIIYFSVILMLILPTFNAMSGLLPEPEKKDFNSIFNGGKFNVKEIIVNLEPQSFIYENMTEISKNYDWNVHLYVPDPVPESMPIAIYLHGYEGEEEWVYIDSLESMASNGVAVIFPQYASNYDVSKYDESMLKYFEGGSNHPQHEWRYSMAWDGVIKGYDYLNKNYDQLSVNNLWVGGHSMGAGTSMYIASEASKMGWGNKSYIINLEAPWIYSNYEPYRGNMSFLPDHTIINIVEYEDDIVVDRCIGVWTFDRLKNKDGFGELNNENTFYLKVYSDKRGFPRLISSHYVQATPIRDSLADFAYYKRIIAQSIYLFGISNDNLDMVNETIKYFKSDSDELKNMGVWSNGIPVNKIEIYNDPLGINLYDCDQSIK